MLEGIGGRPLEIYKVSIDVLAISILVLFGLAGFAAIFFTTFGTLIILIGAVLYAILTSLSILGLRDLVMLLIFYLIGEVFEYLFIILGAKKFGASNKAIVGALVGAGLGAVLGVGFLGIGIILGTFLGIFLGAFVTELFVYKDLKRSLKSGVGGLLGRIGSIFAKILVAFAMFSVIIFRVMSS